LRCVISDLAENCVATLQVRRFYRSDEELRAIGAGAGVRHREQERLVKREFGVNLITKLIAGAAVTHPQRVATLNHEIWNDAVEYDIRVEGRRKFLPRVRMSPLFRPGCEANKVLDGDGSVIPKKVHPNLSVVCVDGCNVGVNRHASILPLLKLYPNRERGDNESLRRRHG
jgi:hypothetical protein